MTKSILVTFLFYVISFGMLLQAQVNAKANLSFDDKVNNWLAERHVPAVGIGIIENGKIKSVNVFGELEKGVITII